MTEEKSKRKLVTRIVSAVVLAPLVLGAVWYGGTAFDAVLVAMGMVLAFEWMRMVGRGMSWMVLGAIYIGLAVFSLWYVRGDGHEGMVMVFWLLATVWGTDTGGYVFGIGIGGPKLAPAISPNKTWSGFAGGVILGTGAGALVLYLATVPLEAWHLALGAGITVVSQLGDLFESWVKRRFGVKDSGNIIPGHGGMFDRVDGLMSSALALALFKALFGGFSAGGGMA